MVVTAPTQIFPKYLEFQLDYNIFWDYNYHRYLRMLFGKTFMDCISHISSKFTVLHEIVRLQDREYNGIYLYSFRKLSKDL
jgi:hypothetical protein